MKLTIDAAMLAKAAKLAAAIVEKRNTIPILSNALLAVEGGALTIRATDLDSMVTLTLPCDGGEDGTLTVPAYELADLAGKAAKNKGAQVELSAAEGKLAIVSGRSRFSLNALPVDNFPVFAAWEAAESWEADASTYADFRAEGVEIAETAAKKLAKVAKYIGVSAAQFTRRDGEDGADRFRMESYANAPGRVFVTFETKLAAPVLANWKPARRDRFTFGYNADAQRESADYLRNMRATLGLPLIGDEENEGRLITSEGRAVGMTFGEARRDYNESRAMPADWQPPAGTEIEPVQWCEGATECTLEGVRYTRMHEAGAWSQMHVAPVPGALLWDDGAYSLPMPADMRRPVSALTVDVDGVSIPLAADWSGETSREIALTAEQVREMCGPVDPLTFVEIPALAFYQGRIIARGDEAVRFNHVAAAHAKRLRKIAKGPRNGETLDLYGAECAKFATVVAAFKEGADVIDASIEAEGGLPREEAPAEPSNVIAFPAPVAAEPIAEARTVESALPESVPEYASDYAEPMPAEPVDDSADPFDGFCDESDFVDAPSVEAAPDPVADEGEALVQLLADCAPAVEPSAPGAMERRLARLEAALGLVEQPKRSPAHAAAIRRAWRLRRMFRDSVRVQTVAAGTVSALSGENRRLSERLDAIDARREAERVELVAEIDRLRNSLERESEGLEHNARRALQLVASRDRIVRRGLKLRVDVARTRAERDGLAANLQAMSRRAADDAALIERLGGDAGARRFILSAR